MKAFLDVSDVLLDPTLVDTFLVKRRTETINNFGESTLSITDIPGIIGVVTSASPNDLKRLDDRELMGRHLSIVTKFRLQGPSPGFQPDIVVWNGDSFVVKLIDPYPQYGDGQVQAIVGSIDAEDLPTPL